MLEGLPISGAMKGRRPEGRVSAGVSLLESYFVGFGLPEGRAARKAAERVILAVLRQNGSLSPEDFERCLLATAKAWVRVFSSGLFPGESDWVWGACRMLRKFPEAFLSTPLAAPTFDSGEEQDRVPLLPRAEYRPIHQQEIERPGHVLAPTLGAIDGSMES
jgi:hypothetical protein